MYCLFNKQFRLALLLAMTIPLALASAQQAAPTPPSTDQLEFSAQLVAQMLERARQFGDPHRGLLVFTSDKSACLSCHQIQSHGGKVGPALTKIAAERKPEEIVESIIWPKRQVKPEYVTHLIIDDSGKSHQGYIVSKDERQLVLRNPSKSKSGDQVFELDSIEAQQEVGTLMPNNLTAAMTEQQVADLLAFILSLGTASGIPDDEREMLMLHAQAHRRPPATFPLERRPIRAEQRPNWQHHVNRNRLFDFYSKQADYFRRLPVTPPLLAEFPGLDGGELGHWGNQDEETWASNDWNHTQLGSIQAGVFRGNGATVSRGICVKLDDAIGLSTCFNPETLSYEAVWKGDFVKFSTFRHGFLNGLEMSGQAVPHLKEKSQIRPPFKYHGFYRHGNRVAFAYRIGKRELLDVPGVTDGKFSHIVAEVNEHPLRHLRENAPSQWPEEFETAIRLGSGNPYAIDTIGLPIENPWNALLFCGGHDFLPDGSALVCTMQGDVWHVTGFQYPSRKAKWRRFAAGLHQALGIVVDKDGIFVLGRDQITRLHDLNKDGEADFYECFSNAYQISNAGHDFICGLERDVEGNFYTASSNQGLVKISPDGDQAEVVATGFRNPDGLGLLPDGTVTVPCSEGEWTPASMICAVRPDASRASQPTPHFGYRGPIEGRVPDLPLVYLPRGIDNSSGGQTYVSSDRWGPLAGQLLHFSFGMGSHFLILRDKVGEQLQGAVVPLPGEFLSGSHRGRFSSTDGQLYVSGMQGWVSFTSEDGCFQRVRYTGTETQLPIGFRAHENGIAVTFSAPIDKATALESDNHFAQCWNYRYGPAYGSPEFSTHHHGLRGHDTLPIKATHVLADRRTLFLQIPHLQPVNQLHLQLQSAPDVFHDLFLTVHQLDQPFTHLPNYKPVHKPIHPHPIVADLAMATRSIKNPHLKKLDHARPLTIDIGSDLSYATKSIRVQAGEPLALTLSNPDVVPHNWVLVEVNALERVGKRANLLIADPEAALRHYVPPTDDVLAYTDIVLPKEKFTIYFRAPKKPGRYPYLCTFPGHWKVMNGEMIVTPAED
ncbi:MAG: plastocyanin/azurin family copper-binding protein [Pirellulaceae bacterium]|nr:plastocyanin/azurin family copper-binding protein [Pirellulaceae bacterium]